MFRVFSVLEKRVSTDDYAYRRYDMQDMRSVGVGVGPSEPAPRGRGAARQGDRGPPPLPEHVKGSLPLAADVPRELDHTRALREDAYYDDDEDDDDGDDYYEHDGRGPLSSDVVARLDRLDRLEALDAAVRAYDESFDLRDLDVHDLRALQLQMQLDGPPPYRSPRSHSPPRKPTVLTSLLFSFVNRYIAPYLPDDIQAVLADPPSLNDPSSLVPLLRAAAPYTQYLLVLVALYVTWAFVTGIVAYLSRFLRFCFRIGPIIAIICWVMASTGQGGIDVLFDALKAYAGDEAAQARQAGRAGPAGGAGGAGGARGFGRGAAGMYEAGRRTGRRRGAGAGAGGERYDPRAYPYGNNPRTRTRRGQAPAPPAQDEGGDLLSSFFNNDGLAGHVQDYVKRAVAKGVGLEWLLSAQQDETRERDDRKRRTR